MKKRMDILYNEIIYQSNRITEDLNEQLVKIVYLFYDGFVNMFSNDCHKKCT